MTRRRLYPTVVQFPVGGYAGLPQPPVGIGSQQRLGEVERRLTVHRPCCAVGAEQELRGRRSRLRPRPRCTCRATTTYPTSNANDSPLRSPPSLHRAPRCSRALRGGAASPRSDRPAALRGMRLYPPLGLRLMNAGARGAGHAEHGILGEPSPKLRGNLIDELHRLRRVRRHSAYHYLDRFPLQIARRLQPLACAFKHGESRSEPRCDGVGEKSLPFVVRHHVAGSVRKAEEESEFRDWNQPLRTFLECRGGTSRSQCE